MLITDIHRTRDTRLSIPPRASIWGSSGFCRPHMQKQKQNKCAHDLSAPRSFKRICVCLHAQLPACTACFMQYMQVTYAPDKAWLFWLWEKPEDPQIEPHAGIKMAQGLVSLVYLCDTAPDGFDEQSKKWKKRRKWQGKACAFSMSLELFMYLPWISMLPSLTNLGKQTNNMFLKSILK